MTEHLRLINANDAEGPPVRGGFVATGASDNILRTLRKLERKQAGFGVGCVAMVAGAPGTGKSATVLRYVQATPAARLCTAIEGEGGAWGLATMLCEQLEIGQPNNRNLRGTRARIAEQIGTGAILVIDEAQYLVQRNHRGPNNWGALEWARGMAEEGAFAVVFCGDLSLLDAVENIPQLRRRIHANRPVILRNLPKADIGAFATALGAEGPEAQESLYRIARRYGWFGIVEEVAAEARVLARKPSEPLALADLMAAAQSLGLTTDLRRRK
jgi:DNA transposition AAA+ family ATPase